MAQGISRDVRLAFRTAARSALITFCVVACGQVAKALVNFLFDEKWRVDWKFILVISGFASVVVLIWTFVSGYFSLRTAAPAAAIRDRDPSLSITPNDAMSGFVGMEYYWLILNRTYVVFAAPNGLYGWKAEGPVTASRPLFYQPYAKMLEDPALMRDLGAVEDLAKLKGGFFIPSSDIAYVEASDKSKWGMGGIPHSGRVRIGLTGGKPREFILLGSVSPEVIRDRILWSSARSVASVHS
jgi:hypothetical protein